MRGKGKSRFCPRTSKRKNERESSSTFEPKSKRISKKSESQKTADKYCWICHAEANDKICVACQRAYHNSCLDKESALFNDLGACPECQSVSVDGTKVKYNQFSTPDKLKKSLYAVTRRSFDKKREKNAKFWEFPQEYSDKIFKILDVAILLDIINHATPYTSTSEFYGDVKFIYHNYCIVYGANSEEAKDADNLRRDFKTELLDLEACPECYYYLYCAEKDSQDPFVRLCNPPHDIVWAQLTGHPYWPAKCLKVVKDIALVRFFGEHEQSNIPIAKCLYLSESHPKYKQSESGPKSKRYKSAKIELLEYVRVFEREYGEFPFYSHKTPYKPHEKQKAITEGSCNITTVEMKLEGSEGILHRRHLEGTETVETETVGILDEIITNSASNDSPPQPDSLCSIVNDFPISTEQQLEPEEEVSYIRQVKHGEDGNFNPNLALPVLMELYPGLRALVEEARYMMDGMMVNLWGSPEGTNNVGAKLANLATEVRKWKSKFEKIEAENERIKENCTKIEEENEGNKCIIQKLNRTLRKFNIFTQFADSPDKLEELFNDLHSRIESANVNNINATSNARMIISSLRLSYNEKLRHIKEENERLKFQFSSNSIRAYKTTHYCCVCEKSAAIVCCLNTSYCSSECQASHAEQHGKSCSVGRRKLAGQSIVQESVSQQTVVYVRKSRDVITTERSAVNSPSTSVSETGSVAGSTHHKKVQIHHVSASPLLQTPHGHSAASSSRSCPVKNKQGSHK